MSQVTVWIVFSHHIIELYGITLEPHLNVDMFVLYVIMPIPGGG